ncbi:MAG: SDR family NAD(P)-dependent oxidoreductase [Candidatus Eisenbacteria bacterium]
MVFLFPGQGAQHARMAAGLYASEPIFRAAIDRCAAIASPLLGFDWVDAVLGEGAEDERIKATQLAQPSLFIVEFALAELLHSWGIEPAAMAGHSIGEWVAAHLAGVMSLEDALGIVVERGRLMGGVPPGAMLATTLGEEALTARLGAHPELSLAAINGPNATVASGPIAAIEALEAELHAAGLAAKRLHTSHAFHSAMMDEALDAFEARVRQARLLPPRRPFYSNLSGALIRAEEATDPRYWREHLRRSVRFADNLAACGADRTRVLLEVGPGTALSAMARAASPGSTAIATMRAARGEGDDATTLRQALGQLWCAGVDLAWEQIFSGESRRRVPLPTYRFQRERYWIDGVTPASAVATTKHDEPEGKNPDLAAWFFLPSWTRTHLERDPEALSPSTLLLFDDGSELSRALAERARGAGTKVVTLGLHSGPLTRHGDRFELDPRDASAFHALRATLRDEGLLPDQLLHLWCRDAHGIDAQAALDRGFFALLHLLQAEGAAADGHALRLLVVTRDLFDVVGDRIERPERASLLGICRVAPFEYPRVRARLVDVSGEARAKVEEVAAVLLDELASRDREPLVAWRGGYRWVPAVEPRRLEAPTSNAFDARGKSVILTGGAGSFELAIARRAAREGARALVFLGCAESTPALAEFQQPGLTLLAYPAHFDDPHSITAALASARAKLGALDLVLHTAGEIGGGLIQLKERGAAERVFAPRIAGARLLREQLREGEHLVCFSSAISATGVFGQVDYCAASAAADATAEEDPRVTTLGWGMAHWDRWQSAEGPSAGALLAQLREVQAAIGITIDEGVEALFRALALGARRLFITTQDLRELVAQAANASVADFLGSMSGGSGGKSGLGGGYESETEARVAALWTELLGARDVGRDDNFFDLGGNSLVAIQLASQLRKLYDIELTIADLFASADLKSLAAAVDHALDDKRASDELAKLLDEIESLSELEVKAELERDVEARG